MAKASEKPKRRKAARKETIRRHAAGVGRGSDYEMAASGMTSARKRVEAAKRAGDTVTAGIFRGVFEDERAYARGARRIQRTTGTDRGVPRLPKKKRVIKAPKVPRARLPRMLSRGKVKKK